METRRVAVDGLVLRVVEERPAAERDDPVLLIHGLAGWAENWRDVLPAVAATGRRAIAFDLPGFGESDAPSRARHFDPADPLYAPLVFRLLDRLGVARAHVAGHSLGGAIAYTSAVWLPERTRSLTLVAPGGLARDVVRELRLLTLPGMALLARLRASPAVSRAVLYSCFHDPSRCPERLVEEAIRYGPRSVGETLRALSSSVSFFRGVRDDVRLPWVARASRYAGPALVLWGREDAVVPLAAAAEVSRILPQAELRLVERCGHLLMVERREEFLGAFLPFLDRA